MSSSRPVSARLARFMASLLRRAKDTTNGSGERVPLACFDVELLTALRGQSVKLGAPVVLRRAFLKGDPSTLDQAVQGGVQRSLLHLQHIVRRVLDGLGNGMAVRRPETQRSEDQQVQRALQQLNSF